MKREALEKINRQANEPKGFDTAKVQFGLRTSLGMVGVIRSSLKSGKLHLSGRSAAW